jgi:hypothetical protein
MFAQRIQRGTYALSRVVVIVAAILAEFASGAHPSEAAVQTPALPQLPKIEIAQVTPNPTNGSEWVELRVVNALTKVVFLPAVQRDRDNAPSSQVGTPPIPDIGPTIFVAGWQLSNDATPAKVYTIPNDIPALPIGSRIRIYFDGLGDVANDYDLTDGLVELHSPAGITSILGDLNGQISLYEAVPHSESTLKSRMMWALLGEQEHSP